MKKDSFIYLAHCEKGVPSSKRFWGAIGYMTFQLCVLAATILSLCMTKELSLTIKDLLEVDLITSASLLGISTIAGVFGGKSIAIGKDSKKKEADENVI